jgi:uncharacterized repeat protein (TIGR03803 family)
MTKLRIHEFFRSAPARGGKRSPVGKLGAWKTICVVILLCVGTAIPTPAQTFTTLASFDGPNGETPSGPLIQGADGNFYGTTSGGGNQGVYDVCLYFSSGCGTAFKVTPGGDLTTLYTFCAEPNCTDSGGPIAGLILGIDGNFYGTTTAFGYNGVFGSAIFKLTPSGALTSLFASAGGLAYVFNGLLQATDGNFYVTECCWGGYDVGTIYRLRQEGTLTTLYTFCTTGWPFCTQGADPNRNGLIQATDGNFYGTTDQGGNYPSLGEPCSLGRTGWAGCGTIFQITPGGKLTTLYSFCAVLDCPDSFHPAGEMVQANDGAFYGVTTGFSQGSWLGTVFKFTPSGGLTTLYTFCHEPWCADGVNPSGGLVQATDGNFYGTTSAWGAYGGGTIFKITPGGTFTKLYDFCAQPNCADGANPWDSLVQGTDGNLYGATPKGGTNNDGAIFKVSLGLRPFVRFVRNSGIVGATAQILGQGFTGTTSVSFNGTPAIFTVESDTYLTATVPAGATTGPVTVTTPGGNLKSNQLFRVTPQILSFSPTSGSVGTSVVITGVSFTGANGVLIGCEQNETQMSFTVDSDTQITAIVPAGAVSGEIKVRTPGGYVISGEGFAVTP